MAATAATEFPPPLPHVAPVLLQRLTTPAFMIDADARRAAHATDFLIGGAEMGALIRAQDWSASPLGPPQEWSQPLKTLVGLMLSSNQPMFIVWGEARTLLYNHAYSAILGNKHPAALGRDFLDVWQEIRTELAPIVAQAYAGRPVHMDDIELLMLRKGYREETHFAFSYTPIRDEAGAVAGFFCPCQEITGQVRAERARTFRLALEERLRGLADPVKINAAAAQLLGEHLGASRVAYAEDAGDGETCIIMNNYTDDVPPIEGRYRYADYGPALRSETRAGRDVVWPDIAADASLTDAERAAHAALQIGAMLILPLVKGGRLVAILAVHYRDAHAFSEHELALVRDVAERTWAAVERARAEAALRASEERLRKVLDIRTVGVAFFEPGGGIHEANDAFLELIGYTRAELAAGDVRHERLTPPEWRWRDEKTLAELKATGSSSAFEREYARKDGSRIWTLCAGKMLDDRTAVEFAVDVTERRRAELALHALNADLERQVVERSRERGLIWQHSLDLLSVIDLDSAAFHTVNPAWTVTLGWTAEEMEGRPYAQFVHPDDLGRSADAFRHVRRGEPVLRFENRYRTRDGGWRWLSWVAVPEGSRLYSVTRDITAEREQAEALAHAQEALRQSQKLESMGQLTGGVAHDVNNLLTPITGALDLLQRRNVGGERERRLIDGALQSAERAKVLVQRLLAFARRQPLKTTSVDIAQVVAGMADLMAATTGPHIQVRVDIAPGLPPAVADANQLEAALLNLGVNARDAMPDGGTLRISAEAAEPGAAHRAKLAPGRYVRLSVADTGCGMDAATLSRAVEPFFSTKGVGKGTGLGLSMVHGLAAQLGGALEISSAPGFGTNVELWLPAAAATVEAVEPAADAEQPSAAGTALLVDDEVLVRISTADMLADIGYRVVEAASAEEALRLIDGGLALDLLVTDHLMPGMNGTDLAREVRRRHPDTRVLIISGYAEVESVAADLPRLAKPFRRADLSAILTTFATMAAPPESVAMPCVTR